MPWFEVSAIQSWALVENPIIIAMRQGVLVRIKKEK